MSNPAIPLRQAVYAEFFCRASRALKRVPQLNHLIVGNNNVPEGWQHSSEAADNLGPWITFRGDPEGTRWPIPRLYRMVGIVAVQQAEMDELQQRHKGARHAVALSFGQAVVVGALGEGVTFAQDEADEAQQLVGARVSRADLSAKAGLWLPEEGYFVPAESSEYSGQLPLPKVPAAIPVP